MRFSQPNSEDVAFTQSEHDVENIEAFSAYEESQSAAADLEEMSEKLVAVVSGMDTHGLTPELFAVIDPQRVLRKHFGVGDLDAMDDATKHRLRETIRASVNGQIEDVIGTEGIREALHSAKFRSISSMILSLGVPTNTRAERAANKAVKAATASGNAKALAAAKAGAAAVKQSFMKSLFRSIVIGTIAQGIIEGGMKIADRIVNAGRVLGTYNEVDRNMDAISQILALIQKIADVKIAEDGSNAGAAEKTINELRQQIETIYSQTPSYTMTLGKETGWTANNLPQKARDFEKMVSGTDNLSKTIAGLGDQENALNKNPPSKEVGRVVELRNRATVKGLKRAKKLVASTTSVFEDLRSFLTKKGVEGITPDKNKPAS